MIHGDDDQIVPIDLSSRPSAAGIAGATLRVYEGRPHGLPGTDRERLERDILELLRA